MTRRWPAIAAAIAILAGALGGYAYQQWTKPGAVGPAAEIDTRAREALEAARRKEAEAVVQRQAALEAEKRQKEQEAADARQRQIEADEARRRKVLADAAQAEAEAKRKEQQRIAALEEARRKAEETRRNAEAEEARRKSEAEAEARRKEQQRFAALEEEKRKEAERVRLAAVPDDAKRAEFVRQIQQILKRTRCYEGAVNGSSDETQEGLDRFVENAAKKASLKPPRIELAKATVGDFEAWLRDANLIQGSLCPPPAKPKTQEAAPKRQEQRAPQRQTQPRPSYSPRPSGVGTIQGIQ